MKNKILILVVASVLAIVGFSGCTDVTTADVTEITYYPTITITGNSTVLIAQGAQYTDQGATALENGESTDVTTTSNVDPSTIGSYSVVYTATNKDGFSASATRTVIVYDPNVSTMDLSGTYSANVDRNGTTSFSDNPVTLTAIGTPDVTGVYEISDWIGGFYDKGYGYGSGYAFTGVIQINGNNEVIEISMSNAWGDPFDSVSGSYDPATGIISYTADWLGKYSFVVDLTK